MARNVAKSITCYLMLRTQYPRLLVSTIEFNLQTSSTPPFIYNPPIIPQWGLLFFVRYLRWSNKTGTLDPSKNYVTLHQRKTPLKNGTLGERKVRWGRKHSTQHADKKYMAYLFRLQITNTHGRKTLWSKEGSPQVAPFMF